MTKGKNTRLALSFVKPLAILIGIVFMALSPLTSLAPRKTITQYTLDIWQAERGYRYKAIYDILQTADGYLWLATHEGLVRFDGIAFTAFNKENTPQLDDDVIKVLCQDRSGALWFGSENGGLARLKDGQFKTWSTADHPGFKDITAIFEDKAGNLWVGTEADGLTRLEKGKKDCPLVILRDEPLVNGVRVFLQDDDETLLAATGAGIAAYEPQMDKFIPYLLNGQTFDKPIFSMYKSRTGEFWLGCQKREGLYRIKTDGQFIRYGEEEGLPNLLVRWLYEDKDGNLWAGTDGGGLVRINDGGFETYSLADGLTCGYVLSFHEDREGSLWLGTLYGGLQRLRDTRATPYTTREGLSSNIVRSIALCGSSGILIGTENGLNRLHHEKLTQVLTSHDGLLSDAIHSILEDRQGNWWIGTEKGLNLRSNGQVTKFPNEKALNDFIKQLSEDDDGAIWILTRDKLLRYGAGHFVITFPDTEIDDYKEFNCFVKQRDGAVLIGTNGGGFYRWKDNITTSFTTKKGLAGNIVESIYEDHAGILFIATRSGLSIMIDGKMKNCHAGDGLDDNDVRHILEDQNQRLWLATMTGISSIKKTQFLDWFNGKIDKLTPITYDKSDGIKSPAFTKGVVSTEGKLWFATGSGVAVIDPASIDSKQPPPPVVITEIIVDGEPLDANRLLTHHRSTTPLQIPPGRKRLEIHYAGLSFIKSRKIKYKLKLKGYDRHWVDVNHKRSTTYTNLSPGTYTFNVFAYSSDGTWHPKEASFSFFLKPYWYKTVWAYLAYVFASLAGIVIFVRWRSRKLVREKHRLEQLVEARTNEVHQQNLTLESQKEKLKELDRVKSRFFTNISHEFRTPLTLIKGPLEQLLTDCQDPKMETKINLALRNCQQLLSLINQLLDLSKLDSGKMRLQAASQDIIPFLRNTVAAFESLAAQNELDLVFRPDQDNITLYFDNEKMENVICNLLLNAIRYTYAGGSISVTASARSTPTENYPSGCLDIIVSDTGTGIPEDQLPYIFERFFQAGSLRSGQQNGTGIGLALVKELVSLHHGEVFVSSRQEQNSGTDFSLRLPLGRAHLNTTEIASSHPISHQKDMRHPFIGTGEALTGRVDNKYPDPAEFINEKKDVILVIEDNRELRDYIRCTLEPEYKVFESANGKLGKDIAVKFIPDLIVSDVMMPEMDGFQLCHDLKNDIKTSHIPIILLTAKAGDDSIIEGLETGADDYITKPFNVKILRTRIKNLIGTRRKLQEKIQLQFVFDISDLPVSTIDREFLVQLQKTIELNLSNPEFGVDELAMAFGLSRATLNRKVRALTGESPNRFLRSYRLNRAEQLLKNGYGNVTGVAFKVGFSSSAYFTRCFKEKFKRLPHTYNTTENEA